jgi:hypothetical protein
VTGDRLHDHGEAEHESQQRQVERAHDRPGGAGRAATMTAAPPTAAHAGS